MEGRGRLLRHAGLDSASILFPTAEKGRWIPDQVRDDGKWDSALARYAQAETGLTAVAHTEDDSLYDRALGRHSAALARLLRTPAPDLAAVARKLDLVIRHSVFEFSFGESCLASLRQDVRRFAALAPPRHLGT